VIERRSSLKKRRKNDLTRESVILTEVNDNRDVQYSFERESHDEDFSKIIYPIRSDSSSADADGHECYRPRQT
jgi:hypothetical protein